MFQTFLLMSLFMCCRNVLERLEIVSHLETVWECNAWIKYRLACLVYRNSYYKLNFSQTRCSVCVLFCNSTAQVVLYPITDHLMILLYAQICFYKDISVIGEVLPIV